MLNLWLIFLALQLPAVALPFSFIMLHEQPFITAAFILVNI
jgi:hypothetical protein